MKAAEGKIGRVFIIRLEDGDIVPDCLEEFAEKKGIKVGFVTVLGGTGEGNVVTGPRLSDEDPPVPVTTPINEVHEMMGTGVLATDEKGRPRLHLHGALGRGSKVIAGCFRPGLKTWIVGEVIMCEILDTVSKRVYDEKSGFSLLEL